MNESREKSFEACAAQPERGTVDEPGCIREKGHDGSHVFYRCSSPQYDMMGPEHVGCWFYQDGKVAAHADFNGRPSVDELGALWAILELAADRRSVSERERPQ